MMTSRNIKRKKMMAGAILSICLVALLAIPLVARAAGDNGWQIVSGRYDASHKTSEGIEADQLGNYGFIESADGSVRVNKSVEPTGVEDEFIVHLSVDTCAVSSQQTDYYTFFTTAPYQGVTSNWAHGMTPGAVTGSVNGSDIVITGDPNSSYGKSGVFDIQYPAGKTIAKNVRLSWNKANNTTIFLKLDDSHYVLIGVRVNTGSNNTVVLSDEAYNLINEKIKGQVKPGPAPTLNSVTDVMGNNIEYLGSASADAGTASFDNASSTLTWNPQYSNSAKKVVEEPVYDYDYTEGGAVGKLTITQRTWYYGAASLTYKVRLKTGEGFASSYDPGKISNPYNTNDHATLDYTYSSYSKDDNQFQEHPNVKLDFPKPQVKGITYDLQMGKHDATYDEALAGATFKLTRAWTDSAGGVHNDVVSDSLISDERGHVTMTGLPWGRYTLTEIAAPSGFVLPPEEQTTKTFDLCYTTGAAGLEPSWVSDKSDHRATSSGQYVWIDNDRVKTDVDLRKVDAFDTNRPVRGASFELYKDSLDGRHDNGDGVFDPKYDSCVRNEDTDEETWTTDEHGTIRFPELTVGTYFLVETRAPAGYQINSDVYRIRVFDVAGQAGGAAGNMIQVGKADGSDMRAPETPNTVTIADKPVPVMPVTAGPGTVALRMIAKCLLAAGAIVAVATTLRTIRSRM